MVSGKEKWVCHDASQDSDVRREIWTSASWPDWEILREGDSWRLRLIGTKDRGIVLTAVSIRSAVDQARRFFGRKKKGR